MEAMGPKADKNAIRKAFSKAASTYDSSSLLQNDVATELLGMLRAFTPQNEYACVNLNVPHIVPASEINILDIGCGTGRLTGGVKSLFEGARVYASDIALPMLLKAGENISEQLVTLVQSDCEALSFEDSSFDIVTSSLTYQWAADIPSAFKEANRVLKTGGLFAFSTLGTRTLRELRESYSLTEYPAGLMTFKGPEYLARVLKNAGFEISAMERRDHVRTYGNLRELVRTLKDIGASPPLKRGKVGLSAGAVLRKAERIYQEMFPSGDGDGVTATYEVIFVTARKV